MALGGGRLEDLRAGARHEGHGGRLKGGTSFMEDYTYHLDPKRSLVLGAHMLEICRASPRTGPRSKCIRSASAARLTRCGWSLTPAPAPGSTRP